VSVLYEYSTSTSQPDPVARSISGFSPRNASKEAAHFAQAVVTEASPSNPSRARSLLFATSRLAEFALAVGLELEPNVLLRPEVIERFVVSSSFSSPTRRTLRTNLRFVAARVITQTSPPPVALKRERAKVPYTTGEIASWLALADTQPTTLRRMRANALICLSAGAGLVGADLRFVRGTDVIERSGGVIVCVKGRRPRCVPVLSAYHDRLLASSRYFCDHYLVCGSDPNRHNVTTPLIGSLCGGTDLGRLSVSRLRASWLGHLAGQIGLKAFMDVAGLTCSQRLGDIVSHLDAPDEESLVALLGGRS
jgi:integrase